MRERAEGGRTHMRARERGTIGTYERSLIRLDGDKTIVGYYDFNNKPMSQVRRIYTCIYIYHMWSKENQVRSRGRY